MNHRSPFFPHRSMKIRFGAPLLAMVLATAPAAAQPGDAPAGNVSVTGGVRVTLPPGFPPLAASTAPAGAAPMPGATWFTSSSDSMRFTLLRAPFPDAMDTSEESIRGFLDAMVQGIRAGAEQRGGRVLRADPVSALGLRGTELWIQREAERGALIQRILVPTTAGPGMYTLLVLRDATRTPDDPAIKAAFEAVRLELAQP